MNEERSIVDELDELIEAIVHELNRLQVRRRSILELSVHDQNKIVQLLLPFRDLAHGVCERVDVKLSKILEQRLDS